VAPSQPRRRNHNYYRKEKANMTTKTNLKAGTIVLED
jgi:hypothetical protein